MNAATGICAACRQPVIWALTERNKRMPLDPEPDPAGNQAAYRDGTGRWLARQLGEGSEPFAYERRLMPHVATCTGPQQRRAPQAPAVLAPNVIPITSARRKRA